MLIKELTLWLVVALHLVLFGGEGRGGRGQAKGVREGGQVGEGVSCLQLGAQGQREIERIMNPLRVSSGQLNSLGQSLSPQVKPQLHITSKGIKTVLVSDSSMLESAFSFGVGCGYYQDPDSLAGLAHLMEHVVFLGSRENPSPVGWDEFLLKKGGVSNAYTSSDSTVFYILSPPRELDSVISYFTKMLVAPVIDERSAVSEIDAVNQEHEKNIPNRVREMVELAMYLSPEGCPARKFGTGNKETLYASSKKNKINLKNALEEYHKSCYTSDNISVVIMGPQSSEELARIADRVDGLFTGPRRSTKGVSKLTGASKGRLASRGGARSQHSLVPSILESFFGRKSDIGITSAGGITARSEELREEAAPARSDRPGLELDLVKVPRGSSSPPFVIVYWDALSESLGIMRENAEWQMLKLVQYYFEDQGPRSLASQLQKRKLATSIEYFDNTSTQYSVYGLLFTAADDSDATTREIAELTSSYMESLVRQISGNQDWVQSFYRNYTSMANIRYEFDEERDTARIVSQAAESLLFFPDEPEMTLSAFVKPLSVEEGSGLSEEQMEALEAFSELLSPSRMKVIKLSDSVGSSPSEAKFRFEPYKTEYSVSKMSLSDSALASGEEDPVAKSASRIGELLTCVPGDLTIVSLPTDKCPRHKSFGKVVQEREIASRLQPCPVLEEEGLSVFWKGPIHGVPTVSLTLVQRLPRKEVSDSVRLGLLGRLHARLQTSNMDYLLSSFKLCGLEAVTSYDRGKFVTSVQSFSSSFEEIVEKLSSRLVGNKREPTRREFESALANVKAQVLDSSEDMAYSVASDIARSAYLSNHHSKLQLRESLERSEVTYEEYLEKFKGVFLTGYFDALVVGNIGSEKSTNLVSSLASSLTSRRIAYSEAVQDGVLEIPGDIHIRVRNPISSDKNNAVVAHYLSPPTDLIDLSVYSSIGEIVNSPFYDTLRTEWQDGYIAFATTKYETPVSVLVGAVQSAEKVSEVLLCHLLSALERVSKDVKEDLKEIPRSEFEDRIRWFGLSRFSSQKLDSFSNYVEHFGKLVASHELCFEKNRLIESVTQAFVSEPSVYSEKLEKLTRPSSSRRLVVVELVGNENPGNSDDQEKLPSVADGDRSPTNKECKEILDSELGKTRRVDATSPQSGSASPSSGRFRASRSNGLFGESKVVTYDFDVQCSVSEGNASSASGKDPKEVKAMLSLFRSRTSATGTSGQDRSTGSSARGRDNAGSVGRNKRTSCSQQRI